MKKLLDINTLEKQLKLSLESLSRYYKSIDNLSIQPKVSPGFLYNKLSKELPTNPTDFEEILKTVEKDIFPNLVQWHHPKFFGYFPCSICNTAISAEMISSAVRTPNFNWNVSPDSHELDWVVADWMVKILGLPEKFMLEKGGAGGIAYSVTEASFLSANLAKFKKVKELNLEPTDPRRLKFVGYYPETNKTWAQKVLHMKDIHFQRVLKVSYDEKSKEYKINPMELLQKINEDIGLGLIPFWYGAQYVSTDCGACDELELIGPILKDKGVYLNVDAAYGGVFWFLPECRLDGLEYANNITINFAKVGLAGVVGAMMFNDDKVNLLRSSGNIDGLIYRGNNQSSKIEYKDLNVDFSKRITALKIYMLLKSLGINGYQEYLKTIIARGKLFQDLILSHPKFELFCKPICGLVCFRIKPSGNSQDLESYNLANLKLYEKLRENTQEGFISSSVINNIRFLRFVSGNPLTDFEDIKSFCYKIVDISKNI